MRDDGDLFRALLDIAWWGGYGVNIRVIGTQGAETCIVISSNAYQVDGNADRRNLIEYAERLRNAEPNTPTEPLPLPAGAA